MPSKQSFLFAMSQREEDSRLAREYIFVAPDEELNRDTVPERHNVVVQSRFGMEHVTVAKDSLRNFDLLWLLRNFPCVDFKRGQFPPGTMRFREPAGTTHLIFGTMKMMIMGMHSPMMAVSSFQKQRMCFINAGERNFSMYPLQHENSVFAYKWPTCIKIEELNHEDKLR